MAKRPLMSLVVTSIMIAAALFFATTAFLQDGNEELIPLRSDQSEPVVSDDTASNETPSVWFVELNSAPTSEGTSISVTRKEKAEFRNEARRGGLSFEEKMAFDKLWNGLSIRIDPSQVAALARIPGVKAVYPVETLSLPDPVDGGEGANLATALSQTGADIAQNSLGYTGLGIKVGIIDTGVDIDHPAFGGSGISGATSFPTSRIVAGWDFVGDAYDSGSNPNPVPDPIPDDCGGHGTHVAGIVGANGQVKGVAPNVTFGAYRVFGCAGTTSADIMIAAMERALDDGMQVVNMSIGSSFQWPEYPTAKAADRLVNKGVVVVCSIGNSGANGMYSSSAPGVGNKVIGVASFNNTHNNSPYFTISPDNRINVFNPATNGAAAIPSSGSFPMARTGTADSIDDACAPLPPDSLTGQIALIRRGTCSFYLKSTNAQAAGASGVVIYNNAAGALTPNIAPPALGDPVVTIPVVAITAADGAVIDARLASGPVELTWTDQFVATPLSAATAGLISSFSSYGMAPDLSLKPDIGAPGGTIRSTVPIEQGSTGLNSGTSMASPHVAGAVALLLEARPNLPSQAVRSILQNSADPRFWSGNPGLGLLDLAHRQGAGMLDIDDAILSTTKIEPGKLALGESEFGPATRSLNITNAAADPVTYDLLHQPAVATLGTFAISFFNSPASAVFSQGGLPVSDVTIPGGGSARVDVTITENPALADRGLYGGYLVFSPQGGGQTYRVPYAGFKGDYQSIPVLVPTPTNFPRMTRQNPNGTFTHLPIGDGGTWSLADAQNTPFVAVHFDHQVRRVRMEIFDAVTNTAWHRALDLEYFGRNSGAASFFALPWDGITRNGKKTNIVPNGQYVIRLTVEKALSDGSNPDHFETWTSPVVTLAR